MLRVASARSVTSTFGVTSTVVCCTLDSNTSINDCRDDTVAITSLLMTTVPFVLILTLDSSTVVEVHVGVEESTLAAVIFFAFRTESFFVVDDAVCDVNDFKTIDGAAAVIPITDLSLSNLLLFCSFGHNRPHWFNRTKCAIHDLQARPRTTLLRDNMLSI